MGIIKQLPEDVIKKIAAGEVIERPASVVKELVENSIDAKATKIEIEVLKKGKYIKVSDNGIGIEPADIPLLFTRHATSKIKNLDDIWEVATLGFRGEALSSISSVSKVTCRSKHINEENGIEVKVINGKITQNTFPLSLGTIFEVADLFYNVPAREKFLKSEATEIRHIYDTILPLALSYPNISFKITNNKNVILNSSGNSDLKQVVIELLGDDLQKNLIPISCKNHFLELSGYISTLEVIRNNKKNSFIFVNSRPIRCQVISKAISTAYESLIPQGKSPVVVLNLIFKPKFIDVNVHPTKKEVRYTQPNDVYNLVLHTVQDAISNHYKKVYKEKSFYSFNNSAKSAEPREVRSTKYEARPSTFELSQSHPPPTTSYTQAAMDFYKPSLAYPTSEQLFSVSNLRCKIVSSSKVISNMTKVSNKTIFEVGLIFEEDIQIVFSGEITGSDLYQKEFFNHLAKLAEVVYKTYTSEEKIIQTKIIEHSLEDDETKERNRKKPPKTLLYEVWERDNWTCVYCRKQLIDPQTAKLAIPHAKEAFVTYINKEGEKVNSHIIREHIATYDHYLPVSKMPQFNFEIENLFTSCIECNRKKLNSMELESWKPVRKNSWIKPLEIGGIHFSNSKSFREKEEIVNKQP